jgi:hypothetical protein
MSSAHQREEVWKKAADAGNGHVYCNLCRLEVFPGDDWDESHIGAPKALKGTSAGVAHHACNVEDNVTFVIPLVARAKRMWRHHYGVDGPGLGDNPLPGGRRSNVTKKLNGRVEPRLTQAQKHRRMMAERYPFGRGE